MKGKRKQPKKFSPKSIDYDARIFSYREKEEAVSLTTVKGRIRVPMVLGEHQRKSLKGQNPTSATVIKKGKDWYIPIAVEFSAVPIDGNGVMGIDLGINRVLCGGKRTARF